MTLLLYVLLTLKQVEPLQLAPAYAEVDCVYAFYTGSRYRFRGEDSMDHQYVNINAIHPDRTEDHAYVSMGVMGNGTFPIMNPRCLFA